MGLIPPQRLNHPSRSEKPRKTRAVTRHISNASSIDSVLGISRSRIAPGPEDTDQQADRVAEAPHMCPYSTNQSWCLLHLSDSATRIEFCFTNKFSFSLTSDSSRDSRANYFLRFLFYDIELAAIFCVWVPDFRREAILPPQRGVLKKKANAMKKPVAGPTSSVDSKSLGAVKLRPGVVGAGWGGGKETDGGPEKGTDGGD